MKLPKADVERVRRISAYLRTEVGALSCHVVLSTGHSVVVYRDHTVRIRPPCPDETVDIEAEPPHKEIKL
jgi:hypothetical protein